MSYVGPWKVWKAVASSGGGVGWWWDGMARHMGEDGGGNFHEEDVRMEDYGIQDSNTK